MCAVSASYNYGVTINEDWWNRERWDQFNNLLSAAHQFDINTGQPGCEDAEKVKWMKSIEDRLAELEKNALDNLS